MRFRLLFWLIALLVVALLAWQLYGAHHYPKMNGTHGFNRAMITAQVNGTS